jgi:hypothetical protein
VYEPAGSVYRPAGQVYESTGRDSELAGRAYEPFGNVYESAGDECGPIRGSSDATGCMSQSSGQVVDRKTDIRELLTDSGAPIGDFPVRLAYTLESPALENLKPTLLSLTQDAY